MQNRYINGQLLSLCLFYQFSSLQVSPVVVAQNLMQKTRFLKGPSFFFEKFLIIHRLWLCLSQNNLFGGNNIKQIFEYSVNNQQLSVLYYEQLNISLFTHKGVDLACIFWGGLVQQQEIFLFSLFFTGFIYSTTISQAC